MNLIELLIIAVGLSMDAFAVAICKGLSVITSKNKFPITGAVKTGLYFGLFQAGMPLAGYGLGIGFADKITTFDHWIAFVLLAFIGGKMIINNEKQEANAEKDDKNPFAFSKMLPLAVATSIDALAVGVSFAFLKVQIVPAVSFIGVITFSLSTAGVFIGHAFGIKLKSKAELAGGIVLILMGFKILLEHLGIISF